MKNFYRTSAVVRGVILPAYFTAPEYLIKALHRPGPRIDHHTIFDNRIIAVENPEEWILDRNYNQYTIPDSLCSRIKDPDMVAFLEKSHFIQYSTIGPKNVVVLPALTGHIVQSFESSPGEYQEHPG